MNEYIYLLEGQNNTFKIGRSKSPRRPFKDYSGYPYPVKVIALWRVGDSSTIEKDLHAKYALKRLSGEWFALSNSDVNELITDRRNIFGQSALKLSEQQIDFTLIAEENKQICRFDLEMI